MGYTTDFQGAFRVFPKLSEEDEAFLAKFAETRRMTRNNEKIKELYSDWEENCWRGDLGPEGAYFTGGKGFLGQDSDASVIRDIPPANQPSYWCQWVPVKGGEYLAWDGNEKFYCYTEWLEYLLKTFLLPAGYSLIGTVYWSGENMMDIGSIWACGDTIKVIPYKYEDMPISEVRIPGIEIPDIPTTPPSTDIDRLIHALANQKEA